MFDESNFIRFSIPRFSIFVLFYSGKLDPYYFQFYFFIFDLRIYYLVVVLPKN